MTPSPFILGITAREDFVTEPGAPQEMLPALAERCVARVSKHRLKMRRVRHPRVTDQVKNSRWKR